MTDDHKILQCDGRAAGQMHPATGIVGRDQIYFGVTVTKQRAEYLARMLNEPLCNHCGRECAECDADPCQNSPFGLQGRGPDEDYQAMLDRTYIDEVKALGNVCPICGCLDLEGHFINVEHDKATQRVDCLSESCQASWYDQYALDGYLLIKET
jgi:hypothetical protein